MPRWLTLDGYETFIAEIKGNLDKKMDLPDAIKIAIKTCISKNILLSFLKAHGSEVENMLITEWNTAEALAVRYEEGVDTGIGIGRKEGIDKNRKEILDLINRGYNLTEIRNFLANNSLSQNKPQDNLFIRILNFCKSKFR